MKEIVRTDKAPEALGPYSQGVKAGGLIYVSGQIPLNPATGEVVADDIQAATRQVLDNVTAVLKASGSNLDRVIKVTIFLKDMADFQKVNEVYGGYFQSDPPARACVQVAALPKDALLEMEAIALQG